MTAMAQHQPHITTMGESAEPENNVPVQCMITCNLDSSAAISMLSIPAELLDDDSCPTMPGRMASMPRDMIGTSTGSERFRSSTNSDKTNNTAPPRVPGRRQSITRPNVKTGTRSPIPARASNNIAPPKRPSRQATADKSTFANMDTTDDRPGLNRMSGAGGKMGLFATARN